MTGATIPRLRMFAGPNGSGKSRIKSVLRPELLGEYINPDDIERDIRQNGFFSVPGLEVQTRSEELELFCSAPICGVKHKSYALATGNSGSMLDEVELNSYFAAVIADFLRQKLLEARRSFTFETVMSSPDKIQLLRRAQRARYRIYLYFVATQDPLININRVANRVRLGGHDVPRDKIVARYARSLDLLFPAIRASNRAFLFDNSGTAPLYLAQVTDGHQVQIETGEPLPLWFQTAVLNKLE